MGRGRAKAKQTKVARELKYRSMGTDFNSLEKELRGSSDDEPIEEPAVEVPDAYSDLADKYNADDDGLDELRKSG